jgi:hypothetical protein
MQDRSRLRGLGYFICRAFIAHQHFNEPLRANENASKLTIGALLVTPVTRKTRRPRAQVAIDVVAPSRVALPISTPSSQATPSHASRLVVLGARNARLQFDLTLPTVTNSLLSWMVPTRGALFASEGDRVLKDWYFFQIA